LTSDSAGKFTRMLRGTQAPIGLAADPTSRRPGRRTMAGPWC